MKTSMRHALAAGLALGVAMGPASAAEPPSAEAVLGTYADIALAGYEDSLATARALDAAIDALVSGPSEATLGAARAAWIAARAPYQQTEVYRFGNAIVDDWEGRVNAWPLDEGLIDYVDASYGADSDENALYTVNVIANPELTVNGQATDATMITPALLSGTLHEAEGVEANVATGYHAIEFLLWGQDLNGTSAGAGTVPRPISTRRTAPGATAIGGPGISRPPPPCSSTIWRRWSATGGRTARHGPRSSPSRRPVSRPSSPGWDRSPTGSSRASA